MNRPIISTFFHFVDALLNKCQPSKRHSQAKNPRYTRSVDANDAKDAGGIIEKKIQEDRNFLSRKIRAEPIQKSNQFHDNLVIFKVNL